jgi:HK97 gp10 family phage protein
MKDNEMVYDSNIKQVKRTTNDAQNAVLYALGVYVMGESVMRSPVDTGNLRSSIDYRVNELGKYVEIGSTAKYAPYQELGTGIYAVKGNGRKTSWRYRNKDGKMITTRGNRPQPFLEPAVTDNVKKIQSIAEGKFDYEMKKNDGGDK